MLQLKLGASEEGTWFSTSLIYSPHSSTSPLHAVYILQQHFWARGFTSSWLVSVCLQVILYDSVYGFCVPLASRLGNFVIKVFFLLPGILVSTDSVLHSLCSKTKD